VFILQDPSPENQPLLTHRNTNFIRYFLLEYGNWHLKIFKIKAIFKIFKIKTIVDSPDKNIYAISDSTRPLKALLITNEMHGTTLNYFY